MTKLKREFYTQDANTVAINLIGKILVHGKTSGIIVEAEAYTAEDKASHSYGKRRTKRTEIQFKDGGFSYVYIIYGMYYCFNVTANIAGVPEAVLIRALEPLNGIDIMKSRRNTDNEKNLCNGPGKLCRALNITSEQYGEDLCGQELYILDEGMKNFRVMTSERINVAYAEECSKFLWRYYAAGNNFVSKK